MDRKGIILSGGAGTRLYPLTRSISKQLLPVYDKPMIYYPLATLMSAGVRDILLITTREDQPLYRRLLGSGARLGVSFEYVVQDSPDGLAQAFILGEEFLNGAPSAMILGDNIFHGDGLSQNLAAADARQTGATVFAAWVKDPHRYGVIAFDEHGRPAQIVEKPAVPPSEYAITGLYFYDSQAPRLARQIHPSPRGELEITDLNNLYLEMGALFVETLGRSLAWLDAGTHESLLESAEFVRVLEDRHSHVLGCIEEVAFRNGWISAEHLRELAAEAPNSRYCQYLARIADGPTPVRPDGLNAATGPRLVARN
jgi:glucose-1-phosphate thymidylyltransferase